MLVLGDVLSFAADELLGPAIAAVVAGLVLAWALRWQAIPGEIAQHDAHADDLRQDLRRWVRDSDRVLSAELAALRSEGLRARIQLIRARRFRDYPQALRQMKAKSRIRELRSEVRSAMQATLREYRDEASRKVRDYRSLARAEGWLHKRQRRGAVPEPLGLPKDCRAMLAGWRERDDPFQDGMRLRPDHDPTAGEAETAPLETDEGLTWEAAKGTKITETTQTGRHR
jgi:hypothetical protein